MNQFGIGQGQEAVSRKHGAAVWEWIEDTPSRVRDDVLVYERTSAYREEHAERAYSEARERVRRALRDDDYALQWARRIIRTGEMNEEWNRLSLAEKFARAREQDHDDALIRYRRLAAAGKFEKAHRPPGSLEPEMAQAFDQVQSEWLASLETADA